MKIKIVCFVYFHITHLSYIINLLEHIKDSSMLVVSDGYVLLLVCSFPAYCGMFSVVNVLYHLFVHLRIVKRGIQIVFFVLELLICKQF
jgi:hypothetical protein